MNKDFSDHVIVKTESANFRSKVIVGADGIKGCSARFPGLRKNPVHGVAIEGEFSPHYKISDISRFNESLHLNFNVIPKGYGWIFPKKGILSIGVFTTLKRLKDLKKYFDTYLNNKGIVNGYNCVTTMGHQIPIGDSKRVFRIKSKYFRVYDFIHL